MTFSRRFLASLMRRAADRLAPSPAPASFSLGSGSERYPLAPGQPIFYTIQGEAHLAGTPMVFVRLAGCDVQCAECDTDYTPNANKQTAGEIAAACLAKIPRDCKDRWVWITGGEPTLYNLRPLVAKLKAYGFSVAVATSGVRRVVVPVDWLSVSPHGFDRPLVSQPYASELKIVDGLNGMSVADIGDRYDDLQDSWYRYVQPLSVRQGDHWAMDPDSLQRCVEFVLDSRRSGGNWWLSLQLHHLLGIA